MVEFVYGVGSIAAAAAVVAAGEEWNGLRIRNTEDSELGIENGLCSAIFGLLLKLKDMGKGECGKDDGGRIRWPCLCGRKEP